MRLLCRIACIGFLLLAGCQKGGEPAVTEEQRAAALAATETLRETFSSGGCQAIYAGAHELFRSQPPEGWLGDCERLRARFGAWQSFSVRSTVMCGGDTIVCLGGEATFGGGSVPMDIAWLVDDGGAHLCWLSLMEDGRWRHMPGWPSRDRYYDPPPKDAPGGTHS